MVRICIRMLRICIRMLWIRFKLLDIGFRISFEWLGFAFECFESLSNGLNLHSNSSYLVRRVRICIWMLRSLFDWLQFEFEWLESSVNPFEFFESCSKLHSNASNLFRKVPVWIRMPFLLVQTCIRIPWIPFEWFQFAFEWIESLFNG